MDWCQVNKRSFKWKIKDDSPRFNSWVRSLSCYFGLGLSAPRGKARFSRADQNSEIRLAPAADLKACKQWQLVPSCFFFKPHQRWKKPTFPNCRVGRERLGSRRSAPLWLIVPRLELELRAKKKKKPNQSGNFFFFFLLLKWISSACYLEFTEISSRYGRQNRKRRAVFILVKLSHPDWIMIHFCIIHFR